MPAFRPMGVRNGLVATGGLMPGDLPLGGESILAGGISTAGAGTWVAASIITGIIRRTGPGGGYTDTTDTAANILAALAGAAPAADLVPGSTFRMLFLNTVAQAMTFAAGVGVRSGTGTLDCAASKVREYLWTILNNTPSVTLTGTTTNASATVPFVLPPGMTGFPIGPAVNSVMLTPGMNIVATGVTAGTRVLSVTQGPGGITGIVMDANATASGTVSILFTPVLQIDALRLSDL